MVNNMIVADAVLHCYNTTPQNFVVPESNLAAAALAGFHKFLTSDDEYRLSDEEFLRDWSADEMEKVLFFESPVDLGVYHGTPLWDFFEDGGSDTEKGFELKERHPGRVLVYGAANPFEGAKALRDVEELARRGVDAIKTYAARYHRGKTYPQPLDDPEFGYPFVEKCLECGIKVIATHKTIPLGPTVAEPFNVSDIPQAAATFPEMQFEVVHAGFAFVEETVFLVASNPNVWLNLEATAGFIHKAPRRFAEFMGKFLQVGAADRILFATGCVLQHPAPVIEAFLAFEMPEDLIAGFGYPRITEEARRMMIGENLLRLHQIDPADFRAKIAGDEISRRQTEGLAGPWSHLRALAGAQSSEG